MRTGQMASQCASLLFSAAMLPNTHTICRPAKQQTLDHMRGTYITGNPGYILLNTILTSIMSHFPFKTAERGCFRKRKSAGTHPVLSILLRNNNVSSYFIRAYLTMPITIYSSPSSL
ncbi:hypothetical protein F4774DRAFT_83304 [Daldinia eschscholtzii]|nr:hypothetical protein F4774DRAFT_83304 [Daldinia eschscholtzii]